MKFLEERYTTKEEWLKARENSIGGSEASAILGLSKYQSPYSLWALKTGKIQPQEETLAMRVGHAVEPLIASELQTQGYELRDPGYCILRAEEKPFLHYSPDRLVVSGDELTGLAEFKKDYGGQDWDSEASSASIVQLQHGLLVTGLPTGVIAALVGLGQSLKVYDQAAEIDLQHVILEKVEEFWTEYVVKDIPPPVDYSEATRKALAAAYPKDTGAEIELPAEEWGSELARLRDAKAAAKAAKEVEDGIENKLKAALGDASTAVIPGVGRVSWKLQKRKSYVVKESEFRVLRVTEAK